MSRTYRRRNIGRKNNTNIPVSESYSDNQIITDDDFKYFGKWINSEKDDGQNAKAAVAYYHSDYFKGCYSHNYKLKLIKNSFKALRRKSKNVLNDFLKTNDAKNFDGIIDKKPKDILWDLF